MRMLVAIGVVKRGFSAWVLSLLHAQIHTRLFHKLVRKESEAIADEKRMTKSELINALIVIALCAISVVSMRSEVSPT